MNTLKVILLGKSGKGLKTQLVNQFVSDKFSNGSNRCSSISAHYVSKILKLDKYNSTIKFDLWDTVGLERYINLLIKDADVIIFVYDITERDSFEEIKNFWYPKAIGNCCSNNVILAVTGCNCDQICDEKVPKREGEELAINIGAIFKLTSVMYYTGIDKLFDEIAHKYFEPDYDCWKNNEEKEGKIFLEENKRSKTLGGDKLTPEKSKKKRIV